MTFVSVLSLFVVFETFMLRGDTVFVLTDHDIDGLERITQFQRKIPTKLSEPLPRVVNPPIQELCHMNNISYPDMGDALMKYALEKSREGDSRRVIASIRHSSRLMETNSLHTLAILAESSLDSNVRSAALYTYIQKTPVQGIVMTLCSIQKGEYTNQERASVFQALYSLLKNDFFSNVSEGEFPYSREYLFYFSVVGPLETEGQIQSDMDYHLERFLPDWKYSPGRIRSLESWIQTTTKDNLRTSFQRYLDEITHATEAERNKPIQREDQEKRLHPDIILKM